MWLGMTREQLVLMKGEPGKKLNIYQEIKIEKSITTIALRATQEICLTNLKLF